MSYWSDDFLDECKNATSGAGNYFPRFRLIIGTHAFAGGVWPHFEATENVILATSHAHSYGEDDGTFVLAFVPDPTLVPESLGKFSISPQAVSPRSWTYTSPQLSMEITEDLASEIVRLMVPGSLVELQVNLAGESVSIMTSENLRWSTIFLGAFRQLQYTGGRTSMTCRGFYESAIGHTMVNRNEALYGRDGESFSPDGSAMPTFSGVARWNWFNGVGSSNFDLGGAASHGGKIPLVNEWSGVTGGLGVHAPDVPGNAVEIDVQVEASYLFYGFGQRRARNGRFDLEPGRYIDHDGEYRPFWGYCAAIIRPRYADGSDSGDQFFVTYGDPDDHGLVMDITQWTVGDSLLRNADDRADHVRLGSAPGGAPASISTQSTVESRVMLNGNPAIELATMLYDRHGWRCPWFTQARLFSQHVNTETVEYAMLETSVRTAADELFEPRNQRITLCGEIAAAADSGKGFMDSTFGAIGVFPVFKRGGVGVGCVTPIDTFGTGAGVPTDRADGIEKVFTIDNIASIDTILYRASGMDVTYQSIKYTDTGKAGEAIAAVACDVSREVKHPGEAGANPSEPEQSEFEFQAGKWNTMFPDLIANDFKRRCSAYLRDQYAQVDLTLNSLEFAFMAPGDICLIDIDRPGWDPAPGLWEGDSHLGLSDHHPCFVISQAVDWMAGTVKLSVLRWVGYADGLGST